MRRFAVTCLLLALPALLVALAAPRLTRSGAPPVRQTKTDAQAALDARVKQFLDTHRGEWHDMNVPEADGRALYDLVSKNGYRRALEIGTSTGYSGTWIAWALSRTGGRLVTIDVDAGRHQQAKRNFEAAGLAPFVDARLADAHDLVSRLDGPWDFVFIDADKDWYTNYAKAVIPKLVVGGAMTAHNVSPRGWRQMTGGYHQFVTGLPNFETTFSAGVMVSRKTRE